MSAVDELAALAAEVAAALAAARSVGAREEPLGLDLPPAELPEEAPAAVSAPDPVGVGAAQAWAAAADELRRAAAPAWAQPAAPDGAGAGGLARIRADLGDCTRCGLCQKRTQIVFGVGDPDADLMVIGEGPGEQEDLAGEPFVGPAGQMLDRMLANVVGLPRPNVYIANVVKCRPPENRNPAPAEAAACKPFLERQIQAIRPKLLLVLGSVALSEVLGGSGITRSRGKEVSWRGIPAIPSFHPAYLLRQPQDKRLAMEDLLLVKRRFDELGGRR